jgi:hypothetical protein
LSKVPNARDDVKTEPKPTPSVKEWTVEVRQGSDVYQETFDSEGNRIGQVTSGTHSPSASKSKSPTNDRAVVPGGVQGSNGIPTTAAPSPHGQGVGGEEQDMVFEATNGE